MSNEIIGASIPILKEDSFDYSNEGNNYPSYDAYIRIIPGDNPRAEIHHKLIGDSMISQLLEDGKAQFGCELVLKGSFKRNLHLHSDKFSSAETMQSIEWDSRDVCQKVFFRPVIVATTDIEGLKLTKEHCVSDLWEGVSISIPKFAILADAEMKTPDVRTQSLLKFRYEKTFSDFEMDISKPTGGAGRTYFVVKVGKALHELVRSKQSENADLRKALLINALAGAFATLAREFQNDPDNEKAAIESCDILTAVRSKLKAKDIASWDEDPDNFSSIHAATKFEEYSWALRPSVEQDDD